MKTDLRITIDPLTSADIAAFLREHLQDMRSVSPPESTHALDLEGLQQPEVNFWRMERGGELVGCAALKRLSMSECELKSMRIRGDCRGKGYARWLLEQILAEARSKGFRQISLETGSMDFFLPARRLYESAGFSYCPPFGSYREDPNSVFMTFQLER